ncbi:MAG: hypothetical protein ACO3IB_10250, partial [Phycisphaerales bacterium]
MARESWDPLVSSLMDCEQTGFPKDTRGARAMWQRHLAVQGALGAAEMAFVGELEERLPGEADRFIALLRARAAFWRASSQWAPHGQRLPGPLEILGIEGLRSPDAAVVDAATGAYARLAPVAQAAASARFKAYLDSCDERAEAEAEVVAAAAALQAARGAEVAQAKSRKDSADSAVQEVGKRLREHTRRAADERLRSALLRENYAFASAITDAERRDDCLERTDVLLHRGLRSMAGVRATREVALRMLQRRHPDDAERKAAVEQAFANYEASMASLRVRLSSGSAAERKAAYGSIVALTDPLYQSVRAQIEGVDPAAIELSALAVLLGQGSAESATDGLLTPDPPKEPEIPELDEENGSLRDRGMRIVTGIPLSPRVLRMLSGRLGLEGDALAEFEAVVDSERRSVAERSTDRIQELRASFTDFEERDMRVSVDEQLRRMMRAMRSSCAQIRALDREANARVLAAASVLAGVGADDPRIAAARLEMDLHSAIGITTRMSEALAFGGLPSDATVSPLDVVRSMAAPEEVREAAEAIVLSRADELRAAHAEAAEGILRSVESFLRVMAMRQSEGDGVKEAWYAPASGAGAVSLRFAIADEIGGALGAAAREAYLARFRALAQPGMEPDRPSAIKRLRGFAEGRADRGEAAAERDARMLVLLELARADEDHARAARALHAWRAAWIRGA